ncbi:MAG: patatin-like phospholipase family protein [Candidatus Rhabdochlamydia sp.]
MIIQPLLGLNGTHLAPINGELNLSYAMSSPYLTEDLKGNVTLISKTLPEVAGEKILKPLIDSVTVLAKGCFNQVSILYHEISSLIPGVAAYETYAAQNTLQSLEIQNDMQPSLNPREHARESEESLDLSQCDPHDQKMNENIFQKMISTIQISKELLQDPFWQIAKSSEGLNLPQYVVQYASLEKLNEIFKFRAFDKELLLEKTADQKSLFHFVASRGAWQIYSYLPSTEAFSRDAKGLAPIHYAIEGGHLVFLQKMKKENHLVLLDWESVWGRIECYHLAIMKGQIPVLDFLLKEFKQNHPYKDPFPQDLMQEGSRILERRRLNPNTHYKYPFSFYRKSRWGNPLHLAIQHGQYEVLEYLFQHHAEEAHGMMSEEVNGDTPLKLASRLSDLKAMKILLLQDVVFDSGVYKELSNYFYPDSEKAREKIKFLVFLGADINAKNPAGFSVFTSYERYLNDSSQYSKARHADILKEYAFLKDIEAKQKENQGLSTQCLKILPQQIIWPSSGVSARAMTEVIKQGTESGFFREVRRVAGVSTGALIATLQAVGYTSEEIITILNDFNLLNFLECPSGEASQKFAEVIQPYTAQISSSTTLFQDFIDLYGAKGDLSLNKMTFFSNETLREVHDTRNIQTLEQLVSRVFQDKVSVRGMSRGDQLTHFLESLVAKATGISHCTFEELDEKRQNHPEKFKELFISGALLNAKKPKTVIFGYQDLQEDEGTHQSSLSSSYNQAIISDALRAALSIPFLFEPHSLRFKEKGSSIITTGVNERFIDGSVFQDKPLETVDKDTQKKTSPKGFVLNAQSSFLQEGFDVTSSYFKDQIAQLYQDAKQLQQKLPVDFSDRTVVINLPLQLNPFNFNFKAHEKEEEIQLGKVFMKKFLQDEYSQILQKERDF